MDWTGIILWEFVILSLFCASPSGRLIRITENHGILVSKVE
ncbi:hypothetical protein SDC9_151684 [bioreactor metagenome]|uniref:Uncharacterized protein n=1 Tax=bioreactor metagenome TaxID=1076179 RepID=A0A645ESN6_9ZZZZ